MISFEIWIEFHCNVKVILGYIFADIDGYVVWATFLKEWDIFLIIFHYFGKVSAIFHENYDSRLDLVFEEGIVYSLIFDGCRLQLLLCQCI